MTSLDVTPVDMNTPVRLASIALSLGLTVGSSGTLSQYPGSRHWHIRKAGRNGTIEVTFWPQEGRCWVSYHTNRIGDGWVGDVAPALVRLLAADSRN